MLADQRGRGRDDPRPRSPSLLVIDGAVIVMTLA
jgi:hypothetical protein